MNQFTDEQVERASSLAAELEGHMTRQEWLPASLGIRAAALLREFAAGVAPQAPSEAVHPALEASRHFECDCVPNLGPSHCHACSEDAGQPVEWSKRLCPAPLTRFPVQLSSTVDEGKLADVIEQHGPSLDQTACFDGFCDCGERFDSMEDHKKHWASVVAEWLRGDAK